MNYALRVIVASLFGLLLAGAAQANAIYSYSGNAFDAFRDDAFPAGTYDASMRVTGWFEVSSALEANRSLSILTPTSFSFSDGRNVLNDGNVTALTSATTSFLQIATDSTGAISSWYVSLFSFSTGSIITAKSDLSLWGPAQGTGDFASTEPNWFSPTTQRDDGIVFGNAGSWTSTAVAAPIPEPETYAMLLAGLAILTLHARRRRKAADH